VLWRTIRSRISPSQFDPQGGVDRFIRVVGGGFLLLAFVAGLILWIADQIHLAP
jgi:hypothetical protein